MNTGEHYLVWVWRYFEDQKSVHFKIGVCCYGDGPLRVERRWLNGLSNDRLSQQDCDKQSFSQQSRSREEEILSLILCKFISIRRMNVIYSVVIATVLIDASSATASFRNSYNLLSYPLPTSESRNRSSQKHFVPYPPYLCFLRLRYYPLLLLTYLS